MFLLQKLQLLTVEREERLSRTFTSSLITCGQRQPSPVQFAHFLFQAITGHITFLLKIESNFFAGKWEEEGKRTIMTNQLAKEGQCPVAGKAVYGQCSSNNG